MIIKYKDGYKFQLIEGYEIMTPFIVKKDFWGDFIKLLDNGKLIIAKGYAWDGATGIPDTSSTFRAALVHDALYQLMRLGVIPQCDKNKVDKFFYDLLIEDGMNKLSAKTMLEVAVSYTHLTLPTNREV